MGFYHYGSGDISEKDLQTQLLMVSTPSLRRLNSKGPCYLLFSCECEMLLA